MQEGPKASRFRRRVTLVLLVGYSLFVAVITLTPQMPGSGFVVRVVDRVLAALYARGLPLSVDYLTVEFIGNILMFVPLGIFTAMLISQRQWWVLLFTGTLMSSAIEISQMLFISGRVPDVRDLVSNSTGFLIGAIGAVLIRLLIAHRDKLMERDRRDRERQTATRHR